MNPINFDYAGLKGKAIVTEVHVDAVTQTAHVTLERTGKQVKSSKTKKPGG